MKVTQYHSTHSSDKATHYSEMHQPMSYATEGSGLPVVDTMHGEEDGKIDIEVLGGRHGEHLYGSHRLIPRSE